MKWIVSLILLCLLAAPALAQLDYQQGEKNNSPKQAAGSVERQDDPAVRIKKTRAEELTVRPDWYGLFMAWAQKNPGAVLAGLRDQNTFDNFASFMACDWVRDYRNNDVIWPQKQVEIVQKFNERALNPQTRFRLLTYAVLGPYVSEQQQFVFRPLDGAAFSIKFPTNKIFGIEDDCDGKVVVSSPWPAEFVIG
ncbi:MAG TPA: hypothetical protein DIS76_03770, partial [Rhodospirillaceae bacterium]|nr:hypothetical protein [Rhodospirillaceae bacterium]